jgi:integrase
VFKPAAKKNLYIKYKLADGTWTKKATPFLPGQEAEAEAYLARAQAEALTPPSLTVRAYGERWLAGRRALGIQDVENDESRLRNHVYPFLGDLPLECGVQPQHVLDVVNALKQADAAPRTIRNVYSVVKALFRDARIAGLSTSDPCILTHRQLGKLRDKDLGWRSQAVFTREELVHLVGDQRIPLDRRVLYGLLGLGMLRDGEAAGLRWSRLSLHQKPLSRIVVVTSYDRDTTKTETERWMPIHPVLETLLIVWKHSGWADAMGRAPTGDDLVVPCPKPTNRGPRKPFGAMRDRHYIWKRLRADLALLGFRPRRAHDLRRTGISLAIDGGADENILKRGTHAPPKHVMGLYTSVKWESLCREVQKLNLTTARKVVQLGPRVRSVVVPSPVTPRVRQRKVGV